MGINVQEESLFVLTRIITNWPRIDSRIIIATRDSCYFM